MLTRLQQRASVATLKRTPIIWAATPHANFSTGDNRSIRMNTSRGLYLAPRRAFTTTPEEGKQSDAEQLSDKEQVQEMREAEHLPV